jgi:hypothetical protein
MSKYKQIFFKALIPLLTLIFLPNASAQSYNAKDRLYEMEKCEQEESGHYYERADGGNPCEKDSKAKENPPGSQQEKSRNTTPKKEISPSQPLQK